jgi:hypothetical protein
MIHRTEVRPLQCGSVVVGRAIGTATVRAFEKVQEAVKNRVAAIEPPVHQPVH